MLFSSPVFFAFFAIYFASYLLLPSRHQLLLIIVGSTIFYAWWKVDYVWLPYFLAAIAYFGGRWVTESAPEWRKIRLVLTIIVLFSPLVFFKYLNFIYSDIVGPFRGGGVKLFDFVLPLGVSFVTFTLTAYVVDIYRGRFPAGTRLTTVFAYVLFFPHLIAGPILRPIELIPQLERPNPRKVIRAKAAVALFTFGLVKKLVIADQLAGAVDAAYAQKGLPSGPEALLAIYGFSAQIYCDFSGYTDMAVALAMLLGIRLPTNFARPYCAESIIDFWRRWHITLSFWLRDYLYIPLGGNRGGPLMITRNIIITMTLGGLWHGANWTFVVWGLLHGLAVSAVHHARRLKWRWLHHIPIWMGIVLTFQFVSFAWIFFRAPSLDRVGQMLSGLFYGGWAQSGAYFSSHVFDLVLIAAFFAMHPLDDQRRIRVAAVRLRSEVLWPALVALWALAITISQGSSAKFIYFDF